MTETSDVDDLIPDEAWIHVTGAVGWDESSAMWPQLEAALRAAAPFIASARRLSADPITEHAEQYTSGAMLVRNPAPEVERVYPLEQWITDQQRNGGRVWRRRIQVIEDWAEVPRG